jgi:deoxyuridine 5'-triphosphate nucleotidohydrolase
MVRVKYWQEPDKPNNNYMSIPGNSGIDLESIYDYIIPPGQSKLISTNLYLEIPGGHEAQIRSRSGLAAKHNVFVLNSPGTIDCVPKGTLITTVDGEVPVEDIFVSKNKTRIISYNEDIKELEEDVIEDMWIVDNLQLLTIETEEGDVITIPETKQVFTNRGWVTANTLTENDSILKID